LRHHEIRTTDPFSSLQDRTRRHRADHNCGAYTYADGSLPGVLAAAVGAGRIVEVGTALGYTACWLASATPTTTVDTIEADELHVSLARDEIASYGFTDRVSVHAGDAIEILPTLDHRRYDVAFFDGFTPTSVLLVLLHDRLRDGGILIAGNLSVGDTGPALAELADATRWRTHSFGETALAVKVPVNVPTQVVLPT